MRAGQEREPDAVRILLEDGLGDLFGRLVQPGVDDLEPVVPEGTGDGLGAAIVAVQARLGNDDAVRSASTKLRTLRNARGRCSTNRLGRGTADEPCRWCGNQAQSVTPPTRNELGAAD